MSTAPKKKAAAKRVFIPAEVVTQVPAVDADETPAAIKIAGVDLAAPDTEKTVTAQLKSTGEIIDPLPRVTPGRIVQVTVEAYPSHIVTRPAIVVSTDPVGSSVNVHVFWDHFRDGENLSPWRSNLPYCAFERPGTWRFPTRS